MEYAVGHEFGEYVSCLQEIEVFRKEFDSIPYEDSCRVANDIYQKYVKKSSSSAVCVTSFLRERLDDVFRVQLGGDQSSSEDTFDFGTASLANGIKSSDSKADARVHELARDRRIHDKVFDELFDSVKSVLLSTCYPDFQLWLLNQ